MNNGEHGPAPTRAIWLRFLILIPLALVLIIGSWAYIRSVRSTYGVWAIPSDSETSYDACGVNDVAIQDPSMVEIVSVEHHSSGAACVILHALSDGHTAVAFGNDLLSTEWDIEVRDGAIIEGRVNFSGWKSIHISFCIFLAVLSALFASVLVELRRRNWFGYEMAASGGGLLFCLFQLSMFLYLLVTNSLIDFDGMAYLISFMADMFLTATLVPMAVLALLVSASNISLVLHEGRRPTNLLGIAVSIVWLLAIYLWYNWTGIGLDDHVSESITEIGGCLIAVAIAFGEYLLISVMICAWVASRHVPAHAVDYLVILGCGIRPDGTPTPLLAGRVDKAFEFDAACVAAGEKSVTFVPSGGKGPDEVVSEAQSMRDYLVGKGVSDKSIVLENRSTTTRENMVFSREVIERHAGCEVGGVSVAFSTTNYHVFRGYVYAHLAGMDVEGMGSKTKAYFWPNAFLREFAGLLVMQQRRILQTYLAIAIVYACAEYILLLA